MKNFAARNFENVLQCIIPCFEGLLPEPHNTNILRLLYIIARWHGLAKLRLHTESTLHLLDLTTTALGREIRHFASQTCLAFETKETPKEYAARTRRKTKRQAMLKTVTGSSKVPSKPDTGRKPREFNTNTFKIHSLGHYVETIQRLGTTDSYSTQIGETCHRDLKRFYATGSKTASFVKEAALAHRRKSNLKEIEQKAGSKGLRRRIQPTCRRRKIRALTSAPADDPLPPNLPHNHHHIGTNKNHWVDLTHFIEENRDDPAVSDTFASELHNHILGRLTGREFDGEEGNFTDNERAGLIIYKNRLYKHAHLRCNYTTYDVQREQDIINPRIPSRSFIMVSAAAGTHPFWYARVLSIFHIEVIHTAFGISDPKRMEVLWVCWMGEDPDHVGNDRKCRLHRVGYVPNTPGQGAFGFLDPAVVIRGSHLIPSFEFGYTEDLLDRSHWWDDEEMGDFTNYYVNPFVDRDMLMRYIGEGVGHRAEGSAASPTSLAEHADSLEKSQLATPQELQQLQTIPTASNRDSTADDIDDQDSESARGSDSEHHCTDSNQSEDSASESEDSEGVDEPEPYGETDDEDDDIEDGGVGENFVY
ncbi:hypothetical protein FRC02_004978 [Tulasnella sp. 418]|nr:hypothetical protein FRC02_004978 [Tulasnella sp. 418]